jgi:hypothetical protein
MHYRVALGAAVALLLAVLLGAVHAQTPTVATYPSLPNPVTGAPSFATAIPPIASSSAVASLVLKSSAAAVYSVTASNAAAGGFLVLLNATAAPSGGAAIAPLDCRPITMGGSVTISYSPGPPASFGTGIVALVTTSAAGCFTATTTTAFISGLVM